MDSFFSLASTRRSIRKFTQDDIPEEEIKHFIQIAVTAPSGCNSQCWHFTAVKDKAVINLIAEAVMDRLTQLTQAQAQLLPENYLTSKRKMVTFFKAAPVVICVFMTGMKYYDPIFEEALAKQGYSGEDFTKLLAFPDLLSIGAAVQNLLLAVHEKGYGACWMNEPAIAGEEIARLTGAPAGSRFLSLIPIGVPQYTPREKKMKPFEEIFSII